MMADKLKAGEVEDFKILLRKVCVTECRSRFLDEPLPADDVEYIFNQVADSFDFDCHLERESIKSPYHFFRSAFRRQIRDLLNCETQ